MPEADLQKLLLTAAGDPQQGIRRTIQENGTTAIPPRTKSTTQQVTIHHPNRENDSQMAVGAAETQDTTC